MVIAAGIALSAWAKWGRRSRYFAPGGSTVGDIAPVQTMAEPGPLGAIGPALAAE